MRSAEQHETIGIELYAQMSVAVVLLSVLGVNSVRARGDAAPADQHAVLVANIGTYGRRISTTSPLAQTGKTGDRQNVYRFFRRN